MYWNKAKEMLGMIVCGFLYIVGVIILIGILVFIFGVLPQEANKKCITEGGKVVTIPYKLYDGCLKN